MKKTLVRVLRNSRGMGLVEVMIAAAILIFISGSVGYMITSSRTQTVRLGSSNKCIELSSNLNQIVSKAISPLKVKSAAGQCSATPAAISGVGVNDEVDPFCCDEGGSANCTALRRSVLCGSYTASAVESQTIRNATTWAENMYRFCKGTAGCGVTITNDTNDICSTAAGHMGVLFDSTTEIQRFGELLPIPVDFSTYPADSKPQKIYLRIIPINLSDYDSVTCPDPSALVVGMNSDRGYKVQIGATILKNPAAAATSDNLVACPVSDLFAIYPRDITTPSIDGGLADGDSIVNAGLDNSIAGAAANGANTDNPALASVGLFNRDGTAHVDSAAGVMCSCPNPGGTLSTVGVNLGGTSGYRGCTGYNKPGYFIESNKKASTFFCSNSFAGSPTACCDAYGATITDETVQAGSTGTVASAVWTSAVADNTNITIAVADAGGALEASPKKFKIYPGYCPHPSAYCPAGSTTDIGLVSSSACGNSATWPSYVPPINCQPHDGCFGFCANGTRAYGTPVGNQANCPADTATYCSVGLNFDSVNTRGCSGGVDCTVDARCTDTVCDQCGQDSCPNSGITVAAKPGSAPYTTFPAQFPTPYIGVAGFNGCPATTTYCSVAAVTPATIGGAGIYFLPKDSCGNSCPNGTRTGQNCAATTTYCTSGVNLGARCSGGQCTHATDDCGGNCPNSTVAIGATCPATSGYCPAAAPLPATSGGAGVQFLPADYCGNDCPNGTRAPGQGCAPIVYNPATCPEAPNPPAKDDCGWTCPLTDCDGCGEVIALLSGTPSDPSNATTLGVNVSGTCVATYRYKVGVSATTDCSNSSGYSAYTSEANNITDDISALPDGVLKICAAGKDSDEVEQALASATVFTWTKDVAPPTATLSGTPDSDDTNFNVNVGGTGVTHYKYKWGIGAVCSNSSGYSAEVAEATNITDAIGADGSYILCVVGRDAANNWQTYATATSYSWTKGPAMSVSVVAIYPTNGAHWNDYIKNNNGGSTVYDQPDTACAGTETGGYSVCIHGGEKKKVVVTGYNSCANLAMTDALGAFDWICVVAGGTATFYSVGLKSSKGLKDLVDATAWKNNSVTVTQSGSTIATSTAGVWYNNAVVALPDASAATKKLDGVDDDGAGSDLAYTTNPGTIFTLAANTTSRGYNINANKFAIVSLNGAVLTWGGAFAENNCNKTTGETGSSFGINICAGTQNFLWLELNVAPGIFAAYVGVSLATVKFSVLKNFTSNGAFVDDNVFLKTCTNNYVYGVTANSGSNNGIRISDCTYVILDTITSNSWFGVKYAVTGNTYNSLVNSTFTANPADSISVGDADFVTIDNVTTSAPDSEGIVTSGTVTNLTIKNSTIKNSNSHGLRIGGTSLALSNLKITKNGGTGLYITGATSTGTIRNVTSINNTSMGLWLAGTTMYLSDIIVANNGAQGITMDTTESVITRLLAVNNFNSGLTFTTSTGNRNSLSHSTFINNGQYGGLFIQGTYNTLNNILSINNDRGVSAAVGYAKLSNIAVSNNGTDVHTAGATGNNTFTNNILTTNSTTSCDDTGAPNPGIVDQSCTNQGSSNANWRVIGSISASIKGKVSTTDATNTSNTNGTSTYGSVTDFVNFDNIFRAWGMDGSAFSNTDHRGRCSTGTCRIWDVRIPSGNTVILNRSGDGNNYNGAFTTGGACAAITNLNVTMTDQRTVVSTFYVNMIEIIADSDGDDDGLCEANEDCIYSPNFGYYQGTGDYSAAGYCTPSGALAGVRLFAYPTNGE